MSRIPIVYVSNSSLRWKTAEDDVNSNFTELYNKSDKLDLSGTPSNGDVLTFNTGTGMYEPQAPSGGGLSQSQILARSLGS